MPAAVVAGRARVRRSFATLLCFTFATFSVAAATVEDFARLPTFSDLEISPGGRYLAARFNDDNTYIVGIFDISSSGFELVHGFKENDETSVGWFRWMTPEHLLTSMNFAAGRRSTVQTIETRLVTMDAAKAETLPLFRNRRDERPVQIQDRIVSFLPHEPEYILVQYAQEDAYAPEVYKVNVTKSASHRRVERGHYGVQRWMADREGNVRLGTGIAGEAKRVLAVRPEGERNFFDLSHRMHDDAATFRPVGFGTAPNEIYVLSNRGGDTDALFTFDIGADRFVEEIYRHPNVDVASIGVDAKTGELQRIHFVDDDWATVYVNKRPMDEKVDRLRQQFPDVSILLSSVSSDGDYAVLRFDEPGLPGNYFLFDSVTPKLRRLPPQYPGLDAASLGKTVVAEYAARDGLQIPAYVTLPPGITSLDEARNLPFVVFPHGGPTARDFLGFDFWVQFLANRGYGILQMNFRGSWGYGQAFVDAGNRQWGQAMQDDITDGVGWLVDNGYADAGRIAILGGSYGGYAALMGAVKTPDLYQCAVSFAGVSDLPELIRWVRQYVNGKYATRFIGSLWSDREMLAENSPARRAGDIRIPILLLHGNLDLTVDIDQSIRMARELEKHDREFRFVRLEDGDHHLSLYRNRLLTLQETGQFLDDCMK